MKTQQHPLQQAHDAAIGSILKGLPPDVSAWLAGRMGSSVEAFLLQEAGQLQSSFDLTPYAAYPKIIGAISSIDTLLLQNRLFSKIYDDLKRCQDSTFSEISRNLYAIPKTVQHDNPNLGFYRERRKAETQWKQRLSWSAIFESFHGDVDRLCGLRQEACNLLWLALDDKQQPKPLSPDKHDYFKKVQKSMHRYTDFFQRQEGAIATLEKINRIQEQLRDPQFIALLAADQSREEIKSIDHTRSYCANKLISAITTSFVNAEVAMGTLAEELKQFAPQEVDRRRGWTVQQGSGERKKVFYLGRVGDGGQGQSSGRDM